MKYLKEYNSEHYMKYYDAEKNYYDTDRELSWAMAYASDEGSKKLISTWVGFVQFARLHCQENKLRHVITPRASIGAAKLIPSKLFNAEELAQMFIYAGCTPHVEKSIRDAVKAERFAQELNRYNAS